MNSWARSACYPRSTFYPLSDGPSIRNRRITKTYFRTCSGCCPRSQAPLCLYTYTLISDQRKGTFARLRFSLGGDRPSQTARLSLSPAPIQGTGLGRRREGGSIPRAAPRELAPPLRSLLPILYAPGQRPMPSCSEGSRGLSVLPQVARIFTNNAISPGPRSRQRPSRYAVRAGRNLPDKEFRYLRTVIVTAAVYRGLASGLRLAADPSA